MEHCPGQELYLFVKQRVKDKNGLIMTEDKVADIIRQLSLGLSYMQERGIMHRDLKLSNILVLEQASA